MRIQWSIAALFLLPATSCFARLWPESHDPIREAEKRERDPCPAAPDYPPGLFNPRATTSVEPLYATVQSGRSGEATSLVGIVLRVKLPPGTTSDGRELGRAGEPAPLDGPYWVPGRLLAISTHFESGVLRVAVRSTDLETAKELLRRAAAFQKSGAS